MSCIADLPGSCLVHILQYVPQKQRLHDCALVSSTWAEAAAAATTNITINTDRCCGMLWWAASTHARHVNTLLLSGHLRYAPFVQLSSLLVQLPSLHDLSIQDLHLEPNCIPSPQLYSAPHLTALRLKCSADPDLQALTALAGLSHLQRLQLSVAVPMSHQSSRPTREWTLPDGLWRELSNLTHLDLGCQYNVTDALVQSLTCLVKLQELRLLAAQLTAPGLAPLSLLPHLSSLQLHLAPHLAFSITTTPMLTALRHLELFCWRELQPALLASLSRLEALNLNAYTPKHSSPEHIAAFLSALSRLTGLTSLTLDHVLQLKDNNLLPNLAAPQQQLDPAACAALTASTRLQRLQIMSATLPDRAWQHIFPPGRQLPHLRALELLGVTCLLGDAELLLLVQACCHLTSLVLSRRALQQGVSLAPLLLLKEELRELELQHIHGDSESGVLAQLTGLVRLHDIDGHVSRQGLMKLTVLKQLTQLHIHSSSRHDWVPQLFSLSNTAPDCCAPDVWSQILHKCSEQGGT